MWRAIVSANTNVKWHDDDLVFNIGNKFIISRTTPAATQQENIDGVHEQRGVYRIRTK